MSAALAHPPAHPTASAVLREQLFRMERSLLETRTQVMTVLDQELSALRRCLSSIESADPTSQAKHEAPQFPAFMGMEQVLKNPPSFQVDNVIQMPPTSFTCHNDSPSEAEPDPKLAQATVDELNAALAAAFSQVSER